MSDITAAREVCPKHMTYGPCGGVRPDGGCEVPPIRCPFPGISLPAPPRASRHAWTSPPSPAVVVDVRAPEGWRGDARELWRRIADGLAGCVALIGEHVDNAPRRDDSGAVAPQVAISILAGAGVPVIATVTGRDRTIGEALALMRSYAAAGASVIHCVTGDHPAALGIDRPVRFGTESLELVAAAASDGLAAGVGESSTAPGDRIERLRLKETAGAALCILNHGGEIADVVAYAAACRSVGIELPLIAPVPMIADRRAALGLATFPGVRLAHGYLDAIIESPDTDRQGRASAAAMAEHIARSGQFAGINLSGSAGGTDPFARIASTANFVRDVVDAWHRGIGATRTDSRADPGTSRIGDPGYRGPR